MYNIYVYKFIYIHTVYRYPIMHIKHQRQRNCILQELLLLLVPAYQHSPKGEGGLREGVGRRRGGLESVKMRNVMGMHYFAFYRYPYVQKSEILVFPTYLRERLGSKVRRKQTRICVSRGGDEWKIISLLFDVFICNYLMFLFLYYLMFLFVII